MYSVKPGRGPSMMGAIGGVAAAIFGIIWTFGALSMGAPPFFVLFGVVFVVMALVGAGYNAFNATNKNRMSTFDITTGSEESDPIANALGHGTPAPAVNDLPGDAPRKYPGEHCPFCGEKAGPEVNFCPQCGKDI